MSKKKGKKFDLTALVHEGHLKDHQKLYFVSNPALNCEVQKQPNGEFKVLTTEGTSTIHAFAQKCLGTEPPDHASKWFRTESGETLYQLWQDDQEERFAA